MEIRDETAKRARAQMRDIDIEASAAEKFYRPTLGREGRVEATSRAGATRASPATINNVIYRDGKFSIAVSREVMAQNQRAAAGVGSFFPGKNRARARARAPEGALAADKSSLMIRPLAQSLGSFVSVVVSINASRRDIALSTCTSGNLRSRRQLISPPRDRSAFPPFDFLLLLLTSSSRPSCPAQWRVRVRHSFGNRCAILSGCRFPISVRGAQRELREPVNKNGMEFYEISYTPRDRL